MPICVNPRHTSQLSNGPILRSHEHVEPMWDKLCQDFSRLRALYFPNNAVLYAFISAKKVFTPSHRARFCLIFNGFECEGLDFQVFTSTVAFLPCVSADFQVVFRCEGLRFPSFTSVHRPCECFAAHVNTLKSKPSHSKPPVNQKKASIV